MGSEAVVWAEPPDDGLALPSARVTARVTAKSCSAATLQQVETPLTLTSAGIAVLSPTRTADLTEGKHVAW